MTAIQEPRLTFDFGKEYISSGVKAFNWCKEKINEVTTENEIQRDDEKQITGTMAGGG
jgi:hypothetical protein